MATYGEQRGNKEKQIAVFEAIVSLYFVYDIRKQVVFR